MEHVNLDWAMPNPDVYAMGCGAVSAWRYKGGKFSAEGDIAISEVPVELRFAGQDPIIMMATPLDIEDFALGFAITEGIVDRADQVIDIEAVPANGGFYVEIQLAEGLAERAASRKRNGPAASGCGVCGVREIAQALRLPARVSNDMCFDPEAILRAADAIPGLQDVGSKTGAAHGAAFATPEGEILAFAEDAGRHNALDKLVGKVARMGLDPAMGFCATTSRASYEMAQKAGSAGFPMLCTISGATLLAIGVAAACGLTLCCFVRRGGFECVSSPDRLIF